MMSRSASQLPALRRRRGLSQALCPAGASGQERKLYLVPGRAMSRTFYVNVR